MSNPHTQQHGPLEPNKQCPACKDAPRNLIMPIWSDGWAIECDWCGVETNRYEWLVDAVAAWNRGEVHATPQTPSADIKPDAPG